MPDTATNEQERRLLSPDEIEEQFRLLFQEAQRRSPCTIAQVAEKLGIGTRTYQRFLNGPSRFSTAQLTAIGEVLGLDKSRAAVAIQRFKDYRQYYNPHLAIAVNMVQDVVEILDQSDLPMCTELTPQAHKQLTRHIANTIIKELADRQRRLDIAETLENPVRFG